MRPIFLIGYMGSGKTTLGRALSRRLGLQFIDLDMYIEGRFMRSVSRLFEERGEEGFREIERKILCEVADIEDVIVACGGGTPCFYNNIEYMNSKGTTVFLNTSEDTLFSRLSKFRDKRPLIKDLDDNSLRIFISRNLEQRIFFYSKAIHTFSGDKLEDYGQIEDSVDRFVEKFKLSMNNL